MAFQPSLKRSVAEEDVEINMTPVMNLMVVLIPLLLTSAQFIKIGVIDLNLPPAIGTSNVISNGPKEVGRKLDLAITITEKGFYLSSSLAILKTGGKDGPTIPNFEDGAYDYDMLAQRLFEIKKEAVGKFTDIEKIVIQAEPDISYQVLVSTMDASRNIVVDDRKYTLFPDVSLAAGII